MTEEQKQEWAKLRARTAMYRRNIWLEENFLWWNSRP
jgi:hypothetical protein